MKDFTWLDNWFIEKIESETKAMKQAQQMNAPQTAAMHEYGRRVLIQARYQLGSLNA